MKKFLNDIWKDNEEFIILLFGDVVKIVVTLVTLKFIFLILNFTFSDVELIEYMRISAYVGIILIFVISIIVDIYTLYKKKLKGVV